MAKYRTIDVPSKHPRGPAKNVTTKKLAPKQLCPKRSNHSYSLQKAGPGEKKSEKKLGTGWKFGRGSKNGSSPSPSGMESGS